MQQTAPSTPLPYPTPPLPLSKVAVLALRDLQRQIATTYAATPCMKRAMQAVGGGAMWLLTAVAIVPTLFHPDVTGFATVVLLAILFVWTPGVIAYTWATAPSAAAADQPIVHSRVALLYEKYFGLNGEVRRNTIQPLCMIPYIPAPSRTTRPRAPLQRLPPSPTRVRVLTHAPGPTVYPSHPVLRS